MSEETKETRTITMRVDTETLKKIDSEAKHDHRSRTAQILHMIDRYYELRKLLEK